MKNKRIRKRREDEDTMRPEYDFSIRRAGSRRSPFIEEMHAEGKPLEEALLDAGTSACGRC